MATIFDTQPYIVQDELIQLKTSLDKEIPAKITEKNLLIATWNILTEVISTLCPTCSRRKTSHNVPIHSDHPTIPSLGRVFYWQLISFPKKPYHSRIQAA
jgi:hypothetical protein